MNAPKLIAEPGFTVPHPAGEILGENVMMCAECGGIEGHTAKCANARFEAATPVAPRPGDPDSLQTGPDSLYPEFPDAPRRTLRVAVQLTVEVDLDAYRESYGDEDVATIRESVKYAAGDGLRAVIHDGIADVTIR